MNGSSLDRPLTPLMKVEPDSGVFDQTPGEIVKPQLNGEGSLEDELDWPQITDANAQLVIPSFTRRDTLEFHGGSAYQRRRTKELVCEKSDPVKHEKMSRSVNFPLDDKAHLPQDVYEAIDFVTQNDADVLKEFWENQISRLEEIEYRCREATKRWRESLSTDQMKVQGKINLPLLAIMLEKLGMGGQKWVKQFQDGFPIVGDLEEPGVYPAQECPDPEISPDRLFGSAKWRLNARRGSVTDPNEGALWNEALCQVEKGWLQGPFKFDDEGNLVTNEGPQLANPAFRFGVQQGDKLRAVDDLKRSQTNRAAAVRTPVNLPTWDHFSAVIRSFQERGLSENLAMAKADHRDAYKQLPVRDDHKMFAVVTLKEPDSGEMRGFVPQTQLFGATAAVLHYNTVSRVMASLAVRWLKIPCLGYFDDFGIITTEMTVHEALNAFTKMNHILGFELKIEKSDWGTVLEFLGVTITFYVVRSGCVALLSLSHDRVQKLSSEIEKILLADHIFLAELQKLVGKLNFAQTATMGKVGRVALRPLYDMVMRGGGQLDKRSRWALEWWVRLLPDMAPRMIRPIGHLVDVRIYSDACTTGGGLAAVALFSGNEEVTVLLTGTADKKLLKSLETTNEIYGLEMFAMVSAVITLGEQLRGKRIMLFLDNNAASGALIKGSSRVLIVLAMIESFWGCLARLSASCWVERVASEANPADAPSRGDPLFREPQVKADLLPLTKILQTCQISIDRDNLSKKLL